MAPLRRQRDGPALSDRDEVFQLAKGKAQGHGTQATRRARDGEGGAAGSEIVQWTISSPNAPPVAAPEGRVGPVALGHEALLTVAPECLSMSDTPQDCPRSKPSKMNLSARPYRHPPVPRPPPTIVIPHPATALADTPAFGPTVITL